MSLKANRNALFSRKPDKVILELSLPKYIYFMIYACLLLTTCNPTLSAPTDNLPAASPIPSQVTPSKIPSATAESSPTLTPTGTATPLSDHAPQPIQVWIEPVINDLSSTAVHLPSGFELTNDKIQADIRLQVGQGKALGKWIFTVVTAFASLRDAISFQDIRQAWNDGNTTNTGGKPILMSSETAQILTQWLGPYHPDGIKVMPNSEALKQAWSDYSMLAILPFGSLEPRWKIIGLDGQSPLHQDFNANIYPLAVTISYDASPSIPDNEIIIELSSLFTNFHPDKLTNVTVTGVTALVRGTALTMEAKGITYPAQEIRTELLQADILHISNEIPFYSDCPFPELYPSEIKFCSSPAYIQLLEDIGTDIIELDGDHFGDYGVQAMQETLQMYQERNWPYYGGGSTSLEARNPVFLTHNGNKFAFIGCNAKGISYYATADEDTPGAVQCDFDWLVNEVSRLKNEGFLVIATFQHNEYYTYTAQPDLIRDFQKVAQAGAVIVSGSQAHQPHGMEFSQNGFIHYGLGNLFFDQYRFFPGPELDRAFIDQHFFYDQKYISTELLTIKFVDLAKSRLATEEERSLFLKQIFSASGW